MMAIFLFHCGRFFDTHGWHVKNPQLYQGMDYFIGFLVQWIMPLFFTLSAYSSYLALEAKGAGKFVKERLKRLGIPFLLGTFVILVPIQVYIERLTNGQFKGSFLEFYPHYFKGWYGFGGNFAWMGLHLWYLQVLLIFSLLVLPLLMLLKKNSLEILFKRIAKTLDLPLGFLVLAIPLMIVEIQMSKYPSGIGMRALGGWSVFTYLMFFITGYILALVSRFTDHIQRYRFYYFLSAVGLTVLGFILMSNGVSFTGVVQSVIRSLNTWCWLLTFLGFAGQHFRRGNRFLVYTNEAVLPFYVLHQTVIVIIAFYLLKWDVGLLIKWPVLMVLSFTGIMLLYHMLVKRIGFLRFLFGMRYR
jgi:hypothetical protein